MSLLTVIQDVSDLLGIPRPSAVYGSLDPGVRQLLQLANREGRELSSRYPWQALVREASFTTVATESQGTLTTICGATQPVRSIVNDTLWNQTTGEPICGPRDGRTWQAYKAVTFTSPQAEYRIRVNELLMLPAPTAGQTVAFEFVSKSWCTDSTGVTYRTAFAADEDLILLDEEIFRIGLEWRWLQRKGFEYAESFASYERMVADAMARDGTKATLDLAGAAAYDGDVAIARTIGS